MNLIEELYSRGLKLAELYEQLYPEIGEAGLPVGDERSRAVRKESKVPKAMMDNLDKLKQAFKPYLSVH